MTRLLLRSRTQVASPDVEIDPGLTLTVACLLKPVFLSFISTNNETNTEIRKNVLTTSGGDMDLYPEDAVSLTLFAPTFQINFF